MATLNMKFQRHSRVPCHLTPSGTKPNAYGQILIFELNKFCFSRLYARTLLVLFQWSFQRWGLSANRMITRSKIRCEWRFSSDWSRRVWSISLVQLEEQVLPSHISDLRSVNQNLAFVQRPGYISQNFKMVY